MLFIYFYFILVQEVTWSLKAVDFHYQEMRAQDSTSPAG